MNNLSKDCLGIIANYLPFKDAFNISLLNKDCNKIWSYIKYEHVVKCQNLNIIRKHKNIKFSYKSSKLFDIPDNLHTLNLSYTQISDILGFDVKNLHTLHLSGTQISDILGFNVKNLRALDLSYTQISNISGFDVKNLHTLSLFGTQISNKIKNNLRQKIEKVY